MSELRTGARSRDEAAHTRRSGERDAPRCQIISKGKEGNSRKLSSSSLAPFQESDTFFRF